MTEDELRQTVLETLGDIAPEAHLAALPPGVAVHGFETPH
jgi:hypothetical protein